MWALIYFIGAILFGILFLMGFAYIKTKALMIEDIGEEDYQKIKESYLYHYTGIDEANKIMIGENKAFLTTATSSYTSKALNFNKKGIYLFVNEPSFLNKFYNITPKKHHKRIRIDGAKLKRDKIIKKRFFNS